MITLSTFSRWHFSAVTVGLVNTTEEADVSHSSKYANGLSASSQLPARHKCLPSNSGKRTPKYSKISFHQARWCSGNTPHLYSGGTRFKSRPSYQTSSLSPFDCWDTATSFRILTYSSFIIISPPPSFNAVTCSWNSVVKWPMWSESHVSVTMHVNWRGRTRGVALYVGISDVNKLPHLLRQWLLEHVTYLQTHSYRNLSSGGLRYMPPFPSSKIC